MPAQGTTTGNKQKWLRSIAVGLGVLGKNAVNQDITYWLKSPDGRKTWHKDFGGFADDLPNSGTLRNYFTEARNRSSNDDRPWSIGQTSSGNVADAISPDALPFVLSIWLRARVGGRTITVRQARWCARLYRFFEMADLANPLDGDHLTQTAYAIAVMYAAREQLAEANQDESGAQTDDLDAILAFGLATLSGDAAASGAQPGLDLAIKLGLISELNSSASDSARIDDKSVRELREIVVTKIDQEITKQRLGETIENTSKSDLNFDPGRISYWASVYVSIGVRALIESKGWSSLSEAKQHERAVKMGLAIHHQNWDIFESLGLAIETPESASSYGVNHD